MAHSKAPRKRKPAPSSRRSTPAFPKRFLVALPPDSGYAGNIEYFYDTPQDAIRHCVHLGPQFFLDTHFDPPLVCIIRGFEPPDSPDGDVVLQSMPAEAFIIATETGFLPVSFDPWDKHADNWADNDDGDSNWLPAR